MPLEREESQLPGGLAPDRDACASITFGCCGNTSTILPLGAPIRADTPLSFLLAMSELPGRARFSPWHSKRAPGQHLCHDLAGEGDQDQDQDHTPTKLYHPVMGMGFSNTVSKSFFLSFSLVSVSNASGNLVIQEVAIRPLTQDMLLHEVCHPWDAWGCPISLAFLILQKPNLVALP